MYVELASLNFTPQSGQKSSGSIAQPLLAASPTTAGHQKLWIRAAVANTAPVFVGGPGVTTANGYVLEPGGQFDVPVADPSKVYVVSAAAQTVSFLWV